MLKEFTLTLKDILYPKACHICSKIIKGRINAFDANLCLDCAASMIKTPPADVPAASSEPYSSLHACYHYEGTVRELVHKFKYENRPYLAKSIVRLMRLAISPSLFQRTDCLVPVPLHPARKREREFNQSECIAKELSLILKKPVCLALKKIKNTPSQTAFKEEIRLSNLKDAFAVSDARGIAGKNCLLVDDVVTTKATIREAASVLKKTGANSIFVLTFARG